MLKKVCCYNIIYNEKEAIISIKGPEALDAFVNQGFVNYYGSKEAPKSMELKVDLPDNWLDNLFDSEQKIKRALESESGLTVEHFDYSVRF